MRNEKRAFELPAQLAQKRARQLVVNRVAQLFVLQCTKAKGIPYVGENEPNGCQLYRLDADNFFDVSDPIYL